jgi:ribosome-associated toxin RatA of RatAB toxin-antitoxin module
VRSSLSRDIAAPPAVVFALARDVTRWADLLPHYVRSKAVRRESDGRLLVEFVALRGIPWLPGLALPVAWRAATWSESDACRLRFVHRGGATRGMDVTWRIEPTPAGAGCRVTIEHDFPAPAAWASFVDRFFTRPIATRTLATFGAIAEAVATADLVGRSIAPDATNSWS